MARVGAGPERLDMKQVEEAAMILLGGEVHGWRRGGDRKCAAGEQERECNSLHGDTFSCFYLNWFGWRLDFLLTGAAIRYIV